MTAVVEQPSLFAVVDVGSRVCVFHESGDFEDFGVVVAPYTSRGVVRWLVKLDRGVTVCRYADRVTLREWVQP